MPLKYDMETVMNIIRAWHQASSQSIADTDEMILDQEERIILLEVGEE